MVDKIKALGQLSSNMELESDGEVDCRPVVAGRQLDEIPITEAQLPNGRRIRLLKTLLSSACERNCYYCPFRVGRDMRRATFSPDEMAATFIEVYRRGHVEGIFLSSGVVGGGVRTQDKLVATAELLRKKYKFKGYLHLKLMPGAEREQVFQSMHYASRISANLEAPNTHRLQQLAPRKAFTEELLQPLLWADDIRRNHSSHQTWNGRWPSSATQFVVGAVGESDSELLATSENLYRAARLARTYFSRFNPIEDTPFENLPAEKESRQHRLYQASYLLRDYGFRMEELPFNQAGNLPLAADPKTTWARRHLASQPLEVNRAARPELLRIPGIGPRSAEKILRIRRRQPIKTLDDLRNLGINSRKAAPFITLWGKRPEYQLHLFVD